MAGRDLTPIETIDEAIRRLENEEDEAWTWALAALEQAKTALQVAEARAGRAEAFVRAYLGLDGNEDVDDEALNVRARALLAPEAQRPTKEGA